MASRILVTRPQPGAAATAARLLGLGYEPIQLPLSEIVALPVDAARFPADADILAVTSANALRRLDPASIGALRHKRLLAVGKATAALARQMGFARVEQGPGTALGLARALLREKTPASAILYLCGRVRLADFENLLRNGGVAVHAIETYDTADIRYDRDALKQLLGDRRVDGALIYSANATDALAALMAGSDPIWWASTRYFCLSDRVYERLGPSNQRRAVIALEPNEELLIDLLKHDITP